MKIRIKRTVVRKIHVFFFVNHQIRLIFNHQLRCLILIKMIFFPFLKDTCFSLFTHIKKYINYISDFEIIKFQCFLTDNFSLNPINFIKIYNFCIENIKNIFF